MSDHRTFVERVLAGEVLDLASIDDEIDSWHASNASGSLAAWLGLTSDEYKLFVERPGALRIILMARHHGQDLKGLLHAIEENASALAARGASADEANEIREWLRRTGRI